MKHEKTITTLYLQVNTCEPCIISKHVLWLPNIQVSPDNTLHKNKYHISIISTMYTLCNCSRLKYFLGLAISTSRILQLLHFLVKLSVYIYIYIIYIYIYMLYIYIYIIYKLV